MAPDDVLYLLRTHRAAPLLAVLMDPARGAVVAEARETTPPPLRLAASGLARVGSGLRHVLPYAVRVGTLATLRRGISLLRPEVEVHDPDGRLIGRLRQRLWANAGGFDILDAAGARLGAMREDEGGFAVISGRGEELGRCGPADAPERTIRIAASVERDPERRALLLAALSALPRILSG